MESASENRGIDLEKELTCSICTEVLYQPLTLLDCLHTFCGSCLKEWFSWQLVSVQNAQTPIPPGGTPYTCPSCRAPVRDTKHSSTIATLLEMFLARSPEKARTAEEKEEVATKYKVGDEVLPKWEQKEKSSRERRLEDEDRRLMEEVRDLSLREVGVGVESSEARRERRRRERDGERSHGSRRHSSRENSRDNRNTDDADRRRRREEHHERRRARQGTSALRAEPDHSDSEGRRRGYSEAESIRRHEETSRSAARQIEHQSSLRSLISSSDIDSREMEEEILRQIREEGLLDGIDLENIDVNQEDQISERIAEAFRRRQQERSVIESSRRSESETTERRRRSPLVSPTDSGREMSGDDAPTTTSRRRNHSSSPRAGSFSNEQSRPPPSISAVHANLLEVGPISGGRRRQRTLSAPRSSTTPVPVFTPETRTAALSQTDLSIVPRSSSMQTTQPFRAHARRSTDSNVRRMSESSTVREQQPQTGSTTRPSNSNFVASSSNSTPRTSGNSLLERSHLDDMAEMPAPLSTRAHAPADIFVASAVPGFVPYMDESLVPAPLSPLSPHTPTHLSLFDKAGALSSGSRPSSSHSVGSKPRTALYPEPSIACRRCQKTHIEYELHYNCSACLRGNYNICLSCYRSGAGCLHWFGFGYSAWANWENQMQAGKIPQGAERPHMLTANRYLAPKMTAGGADGRKTLTTEDPQKRLQSGAFCASCLAWTNECYWRCDICNHGDWGFCNLCVNQGRSCTHSLLPLTYKPSESYTPPLSPMHGQQLPQSATILKGPGVSDVGNFKPLTFSTNCDICRYPIQPSSTRYHCYYCTSAVPGTQPGDYDICSTCYPKLVTSRRISVENGHNGWRRCLQGHRMVIVGFEDDRGQRRVIVQDLVGGHSLDTDPMLYPSTDFTAPELQKWSWGQDNDTFVKLITTDPSKTAPTSVPGLTIEQSFPPDGGIGMSSLAIWSWWPAEGASDELMFPKGAEVRECKDVNGDWFWGCYMGAKGLFPAPYVRVLEDAGAVN
ncbi:2624a4b6-1557-4374-bb46-8b2d61a489bf [Sclerotinia trifoliorum]|uniref:2624a4b6-1557-4374-bb46-8b2d61a489bf n=1 Tax=Sclerotinia trifoliorum TaxID=28548 RepID=A0A8H2VM11_9HELO|nr:2624a4b6-1557-4374-bb46-8b2d61a489bf [Sclerotinia trifoliorum]